MAACRMAWVAMALARAMMSLRTIAMTLMCMRAMTRATFA